MDMDALTVIAAVSREYGVDHIQVFQRSVTKIKFKIFLEELRNRYPLDNMILMMDNLNVHKSGHMIESLLFR